jgi:GDP-4-dehydro-6-deoxy-D-mannose reductase
MNVLVTGLTGFVGGHFGEALLKAMPKCRLIGTSRGNTWPVPLAALAPHAKLESVDLHDGAGLLKLLHEHRPDWVVHLAGYANTRQSFQEPAQCWADNLDGTRTLLEAIVASNLQPKVLFASTGLVMGDPDHGKKLLDEFTTMKPVSPYAASKAAAELYAYQVYASTKLHIVRLRLFNQLGPRQSLGFFATDKAREIVELERLGRPATLQTKDLSSFRDITDVRDIALAMIGVLENGKAGEVYNAGSGRTHQIRSVIQKMIELAKLPIQLQEEVNTVGTPETAVCQADITKIQRTTGWAPTISLEQTLRDVLDDWRTRP